MYPDRAHRWRTFEVKNYFPFSLLYDNIIQNSFWCLSRLWLSFGFLHCSLIPFSEWANQIPLFRHRRSRRRILLWWKGIPNVPCLPGTWVISPVTIQRRTVSRGHQNLKGSSRVDIYRWLPLVCYPGLILSSVDDWTQVGRLELAYFLDLGKLSPSQGLLELSLGILSSGLSSSRSCNLSAKWQPIFPSQELSQHTPHAL